MFKSYFVICLVQVLLVACPSDADRIKDTMYTKISGSVACYRRMNSTHQIGCSSERGGSVGVVHYCDNVADLDFILKNGSAGPYIPVLPISLLSAQTVSKLSSSKVKISGLLLHANNENLLQMSHENQCPNDIFNVPQAPNTCPGSGGWNPWGTGLLYADIPFPMFYMHNDSEITAIRHCFQAFNNHSFATQAERSLCSLELNAFMYGTTNTPTCIRRSNVVTNLNPVKFCDPLGDSNVWGALFPLVTGEDNATQPIKDSKYVVVAARLDTTSLFEETAGAESPITGTVALLTVAKLLKEMLPTAVASAKTNVLFILFNGETYDYIGSQRLLYDMERGHFPTDLPPNNSILPTIYPENVTLFIELSQLGVANATYAHYLSADAWLDKFAANLSRNNPSTAVPLEPTPDSLPPSSLHTFIRGNTSIRGLVLANHRTAYQNRFYNSFFDNSSNIGYRYYNGSEVAAGTVQRHIADVATMVAKSVFEEVTGQAYQGDAAPSLLLIDELFHCYLEDPNCRLHKAVQKGHLPKVPLSLYVGVTVVDNYFTNLVGLTLAWFTGDKLGPSGPNCTNLNKNHVYRYQNMSYSMDRLDEMWCYRATVNTTDAVSPAFVIQDYDWSSNKYSSWSESTWNDINMRMFLKPARTHENLTLALGSLIMVLAFIAVYFAKSRSHILFDFPVAADPPADC